jgi:hypothetical protein
MSYKELVHVSDLLPKSLKKKPLHVFVVFYGRTTLPLKPN